MEPGLNYLNERYYIDNPPYSQSQLLYPSVTFSRTDADDLLFPRHGSMVSVNVQGGYRSLLSTTSYAETDLKGKYVTSPTALSRIIVRGELGYTAVHDLQKFPLSTQFFAGGIDSIRGFSLDELGPGRYLKLAAWNINIPWSVTGVALCFMILGWPIINLTVPSAAVMASV